MLFQSIPREGWKSQKLLIKLCHDCLSKRTPVHSHVRRYTTMSNQPAKEKQNSLLDLFRTELYHPSAPRTHTKFSPLVRTTITRREVRKRLLESYDLIKTQQPVLFNQLTQEDLDRFLSFFLSKNPNDPNSNGAFMSIFPIYQDLKAGELFPHVSFRLKDLENMIYIATELYWTDAAEQLLREAVLDQHMQVSLKSYEAVIRLLAATNQMDRIQFWLHHLSTIPYTQDIVQSVVMCQLGLGQLEKAAQFLRLHHPGKVLTQLVNRHALNDRELIDETLTVFAMDNVGKWRLNDMRRVYSRKRFFGMSTQTVVRHLVSKGIYTGQEHTVEKLLSDTIYFKDTASTQYCAKHLIRWYLGQKNMVHAVQVWNKLESHGIKLDFDVMEMLVRQSAGTKNHVDTMRLYKRCKELYPKDIQAETRVLVLRCLVNSKEFKHAQNMSDEVEAILSTATPSVARLAASTLFGLSAQAGDLPLFERVFQKSEHLDLNLTHIGLTSLIACYLTRNDVESAKSAFRSMSTHTEGPDVVDFNLLMRTVAMEDKAAIKDNILEILKHMKLVNVQPDQTTFRTLLGIYDNQGDIQTSLYDKLLTEKARSDQVFLNNIALAQLVERTNVERATRVLLNNDRGKLFPSEKNKPIYCNGMTFKILLDAATKDSQYGHVAEKVFKSIRARGMKPDKEVYDKLIGLMATRSKFAKARRYIKMMEQEVGIKADKATYLKLVDGFIKFNKPELAKQVIEQDLQGPLDKEIRKKLKKIDKLIK